MSHRLPVEAAPGALEDYAQAFDDLLERRNQRDMLRRYLEGLLLPSERNKTLTGIANTEPVRGAQKAAAQKLQWFLSESNWDPEVVNERRLQVLLTHPTLKPHARGALVIDETGDRKWGSKTAFVGRQYLGSIGKVDNGVVSVHALWADEQFYYPLVFEPFTPPGWFTGGKADPDYRTKPQLALELVQYAQVQKVPFEAVVADSLYGEHREFKRTLNEQGILFVVTLKPSHDWYHYPGDVGCVKDIAEAQPWQQDAPGAWQQVKRTYRDGREETWWLLEANAGPFRLERKRRLVIATTDPSCLPELSTVYLETNAPIPGSSWAQESQLHVKDVREVFRLYTLRYWVEQSYKQVKQRLGWTEYQVRGALAIRRHWQLVACAFTFCWWAAAQEDVLDEVPQESQARKKKKLRDADLASGVEAGALVLGAVSAVVSLLEGVLRQRPAGVTRSAS